MIMSEVMSNKVLEKHTNLPNLPKFVKGSLKAYRHGGIKVYHRV